MTRPATHARRRPRSGRARALGLGLGLLPACRPEFVIGVLGAGGGSGTRGDSGTGVGSAQASSTGSGGSGTADGGSGSSSTTAGSSGPPGACGAPTGHSVCDFDGNAFHAIGLGCPGGEFDTQPIIDPQLQSPDPNAWRVVREYGNPAWVASEGANVLMLSTGTLPVPDGSGRVEIPLGEVDAPDGSNANPDGVALPAPVVPASGSAGGAGGQPFMDCDGVGDCSESLPGPWQAGGPAHDLAWMAFDIDVPPGTRGYQVDLAWFSAELPARHQVEGTDVVVWWQSSEAFTGNVATLEGAPLSANGVIGWVVAQGLLGNDPPLFGTGFDGTTGLPCDLPGASYIDCPRSGGTGWLTLTGPAEPEERMTVVLAIFDLMDDDRDTTVVLDDWRWHCPGCEPGLDCGLAPR